MKREEINVGGSTLDLYMLMSEGNPGAINVLTQLEFHHILSLDDMNIRGTQIWIGFNDCCNQDLEQFKQAIQDRDPGMIKAINQEGLRGNHTHKAVARGASFPNNPRELL